MKYIHEPKPVEYEPLTIVKLETTNGDWLGPVSFKVSAASHEKTVRSINQHTTERPIEYPHLLPSELWGCARVLSQYFGRLNEIAVSKTRWEFLASPFPEDQLKAISRVVKTEVRKDVAYATIETVTSSDDCDECPNHDYLRQFDELVLFHDLPPNWRYQERFIKDKEEADLVVPRTLHFRHNWDTALWKNNIHTDEYAQQWGYKQALPEFIVYMDLIFDGFIRKTEAYAAELAINVDLIRPLYQGDNFEVRLQKENKEKYAVRFAKDNHLRLQGSVFLL